MINILKHRDGDMNKKRTFILVSMESGFTEKFLGFVRNLNMVNKEKILPVTVEQVYTEGEELKEEVKIGNTNKT